MKYATMEETVGGLLVGGLVAAFCAKILIAKGAATAFLA